MSAARCPLGAGCPGPSCVFAPGVGSSIIEARDGRTLTAGLLARTIIASCHLQVGTLLVLPGPGLGVAMATMVGTKHDAHAVLAGLDPGPLGPWISAGVITAGMTAERLEAQVLGALRVAESERVWDAFLEGALRMALGFDPLKALELIARTGLHLREQTALTEARRARVVAAFGDVKGRCGGERN